jgi:tRNA nucleotidyltransferase (CCA-adding enzyme)
MSDLSASEVQAIHDEWIDEKIAAGDDAPGLYFLDDDDLWDRIEGAKLVEAAFTEGSHPRDRLGQWRKKFPHLVLTKPEASAGEHMIFARDPNGDDPDYDRTVSKGYTQPKNQRGSVAQVSYRLTEPAHGERGLVDVQLVLTRRAERGNGHALAVLAHLVETHPPSEYDYIAHGTTAGGIALLRAAERDGILPPGEFTETDETFKGGKVQRYKSREPIREAFDEARHPRGRKGQWIDVPHFVHSILPHAHIVGGATRDELLGLKPKDHDFLAPGMGHAELRDALEPHGRVDDLIVDGRKVGVRFYPDHPEAPADGIEIAPPRTERSTGPGRHDFEIVADASVPIEKDMERRDFTMNAIAKPVGFVDPNTIPVRTKIGLVKFQSAGDQVGPEYHATYTAMLGSEAVGTISVSYLGDEAAIQMIEVKPEYRRKGVGLALVQRVRNENPGVKVTTLGGVVTPEGEAFRKARIARAQPGGYVDPLGGVEDVKNRVLRVIGKTAFRDDGLRIARGLRFVSQHDLTPDPETTAQMSEWARRIKDVSGERVQTELNKLLMGKQPAKALRIARDTGVLAHMLPELEPMLGFEQESKYHGLSLDEHTFTAVQAAADMGAPLEVRLAALFHDSGKPESAWIGKDGRKHYYENPEVGKEAHETIGARITEDTLRRLAYPNDVISTTRAIVNGHMFVDYTSATDAGPKEDRAARKFLYRLAQSDPNYARGLGKMLVMHKRADIRGKEFDANVEMQALDAKAARFGLAVERAHPFHVKHLKVNGGDLISLGGKPSPRFGAILDTLLRDVMGQPEKNTREHLLGRAEKLVRESA